MVPRVVGRVVGWAADRAVGGSGSSRLPRAGPGRAIPCRVPGGRSQEPPGKPVWPLTGVVHRLVHRRVGAIEESAPVERLQAQLVRAARMADDTVMLAQHARTDLIVSAVV